MAYKTLHMPLIYWWARWGSNPGPKDYENRAVEAGIVATGKKRNKVSRLGAWFFLLTEPTTEPKRLYGLSLGEIPNRLNPVGMPSTDPRTNRYGRVQNLAELALLKWNKNFSYAQTLCSFYSRLKIVIADRFVDRLITT